MSTFDGATYDEKKDGPRLSRQLDRVKALMLDGQWRTLRHIVDSIEGPASEAGVSARLRDLRKRRFGACLVERRRLPGSPGLHEYRLKLRVVKPLGEERS